MKIDYFFKGQITCENRLVFLKGKVVHENRPVFEF
jgi:hypothetical protein